MFLPWLCVAALIATPAFASFPFGFWPPWSSSPPSHGGGESPPWYSPGERPEYPGHGGGESPPWYSPGERPEYPGHGGGESPPWYSPGKNPGSPSQRPGSPPGYRPGYTPNVPIRNPTPNYDPSVLAAGDSCFTADSCDENASYRSINGSCNNLKNPLWGKVLTAYGKLVPPQYSDGVYALRKSVTGNDLPGPRVLVNKLLSHNQIPSDINALALMTIGQLITHDSGAIPSPSSAYSCCANVRDDCINVEVPADDPFYAQYNVTCLPLERTPSTGSVGCPLAPQYTITYGTLFIDISFVYGSTDELATNLREFSGGLLRGQTMNGKRFPPQNPSSDALCLKNSQGQIAAKLCMITGDERTNQNPPLSSMQVVGFREHNRVAAELAEMNPSWDDEKIYQEARRIVVAEWQVIVFGHWLPIVVGEDAAREANAIPVASGMSNDYDETVNPMTTDEFGKAAFRIFHTLIPSTFCTNNGPIQVTGCPFGATNFSNVFNNPVMLTTDGGFDSVLLGLNGHFAAEVSDRYSLEISGKLFRLGNPTGQDLPSIDVQRGRDVGIAPYNTYRTLCGSYAAKNWDDFLDVFTREDIQKLQEVYEDPDDVDLVIAGVLERKQPGSLIGPTFQCIILDQFKRWKQGDRFFYDLGGFSHSFSQAQVDALRNASLARWICDNSDNIKSVPTDVFRRTSEHVTCDRLAAVDLSLWKE